MNDAAVHASEIAGSSPREYGRAEAAGDRKASRHEIAVAQRVRHLYGELSNTIILATKEFPLNLHRRSTAPPATAIGTHPLRRSSAPAAMAVASLTGNDFASALDKAIRASRFRLVPANRQGTCDQAPMSPGQAAKFFVRSSSASSLDKSDSSSPTSEVGKLCSCIRGNNVQKRS